MISKYTRHNIPGHAHELTFSCFRRQPFLKNDKIKLYLTDSIDQAAIRQGFSVWAYVIMPEHIHLMIYPHDEPYSISKILKSIKQPISRKVINRLKELDSDYLERMETGLDKPKYRFWQDGGGYDRHYFSPDEIRKQINYIHNNPVRRGLVEDPSDYEWSSAKEWLDGTQGVLHIDFDLIPQI